MSIPVGRPNGLPAAITSSIIRTVILFVPWITRCLAFTIYLNLRRKYPLNQSTIMTITRMTSMIALT